MLVKLVLESLFPAHSHAAYTLSLLDTEGNRILPLLIGTPEAQAINLELEGQVTSRPLTHDLIMGFLTSTGVQVRNIVIDDFKEGVFHSKINYIFNKEERVMDSRTSDAICIALKAKVEIFCESKIMDDVAYDTDGKKGKADEPGRLSIDELIPGAQSGNDYGEYSLSQLDSMLQEAIQREDYAKAALLRDEISKRK